MYSTCSILNLICTNSNSKFSFSVKDKKIILNKTNSYKNYALLCGSVSYGKKVFLSSEFFPRLLKQMRLENLISFLLVKWIEFFEPLNWRWRRWFLHATPTAVYPLRFKKKFPRKEDQMVEVKFLKQISLNESFGSSLV